MTRKRKMAPIARGVLAKPLGEWTQPQKRAFGAMVGNAGNGSLAAQFHKPTWGEVDPWACGDFLESQISKVQRGDMSDVEAKLYGQASALEAIFQGLAQRSATNMLMNFEVSERLLRLALKAQSQCRTTLETLAEIKNPRSVAFVRQANIAGGHQQINNGHPPPERAEILQSEPNELQEAMYEQSLVIGAQTQGIGVNPRAAAMVEVDRTKDKRGES